ncbi:MAG: hypothetical protein LOD90_02055 [Symbiobacteriaceae bacterium]|nr:MAG: hypothetical protein DIU69_07015 [Bacillota bacterium]
MDLLDLDALLPEPVRVRYRGREYEVRRDISTQRAIDLTKLLVRIELASRSLENPDDADEMLKQLERLPREAAALMTDDPAEQERLAADMPLDVAKTIVGLVLEAQRGGNGAASPPKAAKGKGKK